VRVTCFYSFAGFAACSGNQQSLRIHLLYRKKIGSQGLSKPLVAESNNFGSMTRGEYLRAPLLGIPSLGMWCRLSEPCPADRPASPRIRDHHRDLATCHRPRAGGDRHDRTDPQRSPPSCPLPCRGRRRSEPWSASTEGRARSPQLSTPRRP